MKVKHSIAIALAFQAVFSLLFLCVVPATSWSQERTTGASTVEDMLFAPFDALFVAGVLDAQANLSHLKSPPAAPAIQDLTPENRDLIWRGEPGASQLLATTFTKSAYYANLTPGQTIPAAVDLWVVPAPQMYEEVRENNPLGAGLSPQLAASQYLGLPPRNTNDAVVSVWVSPATMLRPAIDPRIDTHELETSFPFTLQNVPLTQAPALPKDSPASGFAPAADYASWFLERQSAIFNLAVSGGPYPWTGLGYTYDWTPAAPDVVGGSEFLVPRGSPVVIESVVPVGRYFQ